MKKRELIECLSQNWLDGLVEAEGLCLCGTCKRMTLSPKVQDWYLETFSDSNLVDKRLICATCAGKRPFYTAWISAEDETITKFKQRGTNEW